jgi:TRAP-type uncharacterized transport system fused permease subunit
VPYMAVYDPNLMLQPVAGLEGFSYWLAVLYIVAKATFAMLLWGMAVVGYLRAPLAMWERVLCAVAAALMVTAMPITDELGFLLGGGFVAWHLWRARQARPQMA